MGKYLTHSKEVVWRRIGDDIVIIKDGGISTYVLNKTASLIWEACDGYANIEKITSKICECFEVSYEEAYADVNATVNILTKANILK